ncbi:basic 7S globulin-like [Abrus precatorius]|uniref:SBg7S n=1 Tax=Abrus precatorius TaxID=3816 RepID=A0A8B8LA43_ABRPR|nr:basic 7S globulin-like [Abrus precatorius]
MSSILHYLAIFLSCYFLFFLSETQSLSQPRTSPPFKPNLLVLPVHQDASTGLHWANVHKRTPLMQVPVLVDLNGNHLWVNCDQHYSSKTYQAPFCHSTLCSRANSHQCLSCNSASSRPGCHKNTCGLTSINPVTEQTGLGEVGQDVLAIHATRGSQVGPLVTVPQFLFSCAPSFLLQKGLPNKVQGVAGLGHAPISLPNQLASHFGFQRQFTLCLSRYPTSKGAIIFGDAPNNLGQFRGQNIFRDLAYTPLTVNPLGEYNVKITSIRINQHTVVPVNPSTISSTSSASGIGGTIVSTATPYMILHHSIFEAFSQVFTKQVPSQAQVKAVASFALCFDSKKIGPYPNVELVMDKPNVVWRISGENLMVQPLPGVTCLAMVNGGMHPKAPITIGARQLEENIVVFDSARSRLGFSTSLPSYGVKCADLFNIIDP